MTEKNKKNIIVFWQKEHCTSFSTRNVKHLKYVFTKRGRERIREKGIMVKGREDEEWQVMRGRDMCVCKREKEREREKDRQRGREAERKRETERKRERDRDR